MFLKKKCNFLKTVKFKITLWYAILFIISSSFIFIPLYLIISYNFLKRVDNQLIAIFNKIEWHYKKWSKDNPDGSNINFFQEEFDLLADKEGSNKILFLLLSDSGEVLAKSDLITWKNIGEKTSLLKSFVNQGKITTVEISKSKEKTIRVYSKPFSETKTTLIIGLGLKKEQELLNSYVSIFISIIIPLLIISSIIGWFLAKRAMSGVDRVSETALMIGKGDFSKQVPLLSKDGEEIRNLVLAFNSMITKTHELISELKDVSDNIAHDLRTPLTRIRGMLDVTIDSNPGKEDYQEMASEIAEECDRLVNIINTMLEITQTDSGVKQLFFKEVNVSKIIEEAYNLFSALAEEKKLYIQLKIPLVPIIINADGVALQRVVSNLLDNAIKYTPENGKILITVTTKVNNVMISIKDTGFGISEDEQKHIFERFYRGDSSRSQPGNGLGLSLASALVKAHHGKIEVQSSLGSGSEFRVILPL